MLVRRKMVQYCVIAFVNMNEIGGMRRRRYEEEEEEEAGGGGGMRRMRRRQDEHTIVYNFSWNQTKGLTPWPVYNAH